MNKVLGYIEAGTAEGAELILGGQRVHPGADDALKGGFYIEPTIFDRVDPKAKIAQEEIFGPVLSVLGFKDEAEGIRLANDSPFGLAGYAATTTLARMQRLSDQINVGSLAIIGDSALSGGGVNIGSDKHRQSGLGYSGGLDGLAAYSITTTVKLFT